MMEAGDVFTSQAVSSITTVFPGRMLKDGVLAESFAGNGTCDNAKMCQLHKLNVLREKTERTNNTDLTK